MSDNEAWTSITAQVSAVARANPDASAIQAPDGCLTYRELTTRADRLAQQLTDLGLAPGEVLGVCLPRGAEQVLAALAALRANAAYLPLDPADPPARTAQVLTTARVRLAVCLPDRIESLAAHDIRALPAGQPAAPADPLPPPAPSPRPADLAYIIYTSGSTGEPKGVMVTQGGLSNLVRWNQDTLGLTSQDRTTLIASPGFDASVLEIWQALTVGACLVVPDDQTRLSPHRLRDWLVTQQVTMSFVPTPLAELLLGQSWPPDCRLRVLQIGGEQLRLRPPAGLPFQLVNYYGPAECTVVATAGAVEAKTDSSQRPPPIGRPIHGVELRVLTPDLVEADIGELGEIYLGGVALARGYLHRPDLTADRFVPDPAGAGSRLYRTGDLARRLPHGELAFHGRSDDQLKVRGNRIEPAEVSSALLDYPGVAAAYTTAVERTDGGPELVAYLVPADHRRIPEASAVQRYLADRLPKYLVPAEFVVLGSLPLTRNGKVDRAALPAPQRPDSTEYVPPSSPTEQALAEIWQEVFEQERIGVQDTLFELGGNSLSAAQLVARVRDQLGVDLPAAAIFHHPSIAELSKQIEALAPATITGELPPLRVVPRTARMPLSLMQEQMWFLNQLSPSTSTYHAQATIRVNGPLDVPVLERALAEVTRRHEILRTTYENVNGRLWQVTHPPFPVPVPVVDLRELAEPAREARLAELIDQQIQQPFDLSRLPLVRWCAVHLAEQEWELVVVEHHLVHDGWSMARLMSELTALYRAYAAGEPSPLPELPMQYVDYASWQREALSSPAMGSQIEYWRRRLSDPPPPLVIPSSQPRPARPGYRGDRLRVELPAALPDPLRRLCRANGVSLFTALLATYTILLTRLTGVSDLCIGSAFGNRRFRQVEPLLGMFVNNVVLRCDTAGDPTFRELLQRTQPTVLDAAAHQDVPFSHLVRELKPPRQTGVNPYYQVMFSFNDSPAPELDFAGSPATLFELPNGSAKVDLDLAVIPRAERQSAGSAQRDSRITMLWDYHLDVFHRAEVEAISNRYERLLAGALTDPDQPISRLPD